MQRREQFVGDRCLALSIKFLEMSMSYKATRTLLKPHIETILFNISLPLFVTSGKDMVTFQEDPIEYVRLQNDCQNEYNVKTQLSKLVDAMCGLKFGKKKDKLAPMHLKNYMRTIGENLEGLKG